MEPPPSGMIPLYVKIMAVVYATLILKGRKTIEQIPTLIKAQVEQILVDLEVEL